MSGISTHVLDLGLGVPARGIAVRLERHSGTDWDRAGESRTDEDGRVRDLLPPSVRLAPGLYRLAFATGDYFEARNQPTFYPEVVVTFEIRDPNQHYHVPLLLGAFGYTTYRGS